MNRRLLQRLFGIYVASNYGMQMLYESTLKESTLKGNTPNYKQKSQPKQQQEFTIKGYKIMATSRKDAIKKYEHIKRK